MDGDYAPNEGRWGDMHLDILVKIFETFDIFELSVIAQVCCGWRLAACDPTLWRELDLSTLKSNFIRTQVEPFVYVDSSSDETLTKLLKISLNLSRGCISTLVFHFNLYISDDQLTYTAERCPRLKRLVMPAWNRIKETGICKAISMWPDLESLTFESIANPPYLIEQIAKNCKNFSHLRVMDPFDDDFASTLVKFLPNLKALSIRCSAISRHALIILLDGLKNLEVLNISHCLLEDLDEYIMEKASRLQEFLFCMDDSCEMCQRVRSDEGLMRWHKYEEGLWKQDEVRSFTL